MSSLHPLFRIPPPDESPPTPPWEELRERLDKIGRLQIKMQALLETGHPGPPSSSPGSGPLTEDLIQLMDGLDHCMSFLDEGRTADSDRFRNGLDLLRQKGLSALEKNDIHPIDAVGSRFDPSLHMAVDTVCQEGVKDYIIVHEEKRGYRLQDQVLRPAEVIVNRR